MRREILRFGLGMVLGILAFGNVPAPAAGNRNSGARREFQPVVTPESAPNGFSACQATAEVYDEVERPDLDSAVPRTYR